MSARLQGHRRFSAEATIRLLQDELAATNREVLALTLDLEERVAERTAQLSQANQALAKEVKERARAEDEIRQLNAYLTLRATQLEEANNNLEAFSYSVSHDLQAPLRHISGYAEMLNERTAGILDEESREHLERIREAANRMTRLILDLLRFARLTQVELSTEKVDLNELIPGIIGDFDLEIKERNVVWNCALLPAVRGDIALLRQVLVNLVSNALKYSRRRDPSEIEIGFQEEGDKVTIFVRDNGEGFDPRNANQLFGVFKRLHSGQEFEGTGIGLALVRQIIIRHGGRTWAEGKPGEGATFYFSVPKS